MKRSKVMDAASTAFAAYAGGVMHLLDSSAERCAGGALIGSGLEEDVIVPVHQKSTTVIARHNEFIGNSSGVTAENHAGVSVTDCCTKHDTSGAAFVARGQGYGRARLCVHHCRVMMQLERWGSNMHIRHRACRAEDGGLLKMDGVVVNSDLSRSGEFDESQPRITS